MSETVRNIYPCIRTQVGVNKAADAGAAYIYDFIDNVWSETTMLSYSGGSASDYFGYAVALCDTSLAGREYSDTYARFKILWFQRRKSTNICGPEW